MAYFLIFGIFFFMVMSFNTINVNSAKKIAKKYPAVAMIQKPKEENNNNEIIYEC